jgi:hypothetical protein
VIVVRCGGTTTLLIIITDTTPFEASLDSNASSIIRSIENFKVVGFGVFIVVCIMPTRLASILIYRAIKEFSQQSAFFI